MFKELNWVHYTSVALPKSDLALGRSFEEYVEHVWGILSRSGSVVVPGALNYWLCPF